MRIDPVDCGFITGASQNGATSANIIQTLATPRLFTGENKKNFFYIWVGCNLLWWNQVSEQADRGVKGSGCGRQKKTFKSTVVSRVTMVTKRREKLCHILAICYYEALTLITEEV
jgi:hypothetical protein